MIYSNPTISLAHLDKAPKKEPNSPFRISPCLHVRPSLSILSMTWSCDGAAPSKSMAFLCFHSPNVPRVVAISDPVDALSFKVCVCRWHSLWLVQHMAYTC